MKRITILAVSLCVAGVMLSQTTPEELPGVPFHKFSPDGKWAVSNSGDNSPVVIIDFVSGKQYSYTETFVEGSGNCISNNGVVTGYKMSDERASIWRNGGYGYLPIPSGTILSYANGITPDGSRIAGCISPSSYAGDYEGIMGIPCYWDLQPDGSYSNPILLPYPEKDYIGRVPSYITAVQISADGKTIAGQVLDYRGSVCQPIVYSQDTNGGWNYNLLIDELFHPAGIQIPVDPGDGPTPTDFMTPQELADYEQAVKKWEETGNDNPETYPDIEDFMTQQEIDNYNNAKEKWEEDWLNFDNSLWELMLAVPNFSYNNVFLSTDGKIYATTDAKYFQDEVTGINFKEFVPYRIDIESNTYQSFPNDDLQIMISSLIDDGTLIGNTQDTDYYIFNGYILPPDEQDFISLYDFMVDQQPATAQWMKEHMTHTYDLFDPSDWSLTPTSILATGIPFSTPDMSLIGFAQFNFWEDYPTSPFYGYLIGLPPYSKVENIADIEGAKVWLQKDGYLVVKGNLKNVEIFSLNGLKVFEAENPSGLVSTGLASGIYILRATSPSGEIITLKSSVKN